MRTDVQIKAESRLVGPVELAKLQLEVLLDIRAGLRAVRQEQTRTAEQLMPCLRYIMADLKTLAERWKKAGRPRKKKKDGPQPARQ